MKIWVVRAACIVGLLVGLVGIGLIFTPFFIPQCMSAEYSSNLHCPPSLTPTQVEVLFVSFVFLAVVSALGLAYPFIGWGLMRKGIERDSKLRPVLSLLGIVAGGTTAATGMRVNEIVSQCRLAICAAPYEPLILPLLLIGAVVLGASFFLFVGSLKSSWNRLRTRPYP